jgi:hypothetical protein
VAAMSRRRIAVIVGAAAAAAVFAGAVGAGHDWSRSSAELEAALVDAPPTRVADIPAADGLPARGVFAQITSTGQFCLSDAALDAPLMGGGGCNPLGDPLGGSAISASLAYDGGPTIETVRDARLIGLADSDVVSVRVLMSDGSSRAVKLRKTQVGADEFAVFGHRVRKSDLKKGIGPIAVVAYDESGAEIDRQTTGIG